MLRLFVQRRILFVGLFRVFLLTFVVFFNPSPAMRKGKRRRQGRRSRQADERDDVVCVAGLRQLGLRDIGRGLLDDTDALALVVDRCV